MSQSTEELDRLVQRTGFGDEEMNDSVRVKILLQTSHPDFWRINAEKHANYKRVKNWLWVHSRYRDQVKYASHLQWFIRWKMHANLEIISCFCFR